MNISKENYWLVKHCIENKKSDILRYCNTIDDLPIKRNHFHPIQLLRIKERIKCNFLEYISPNSLDRILTQLCEENLLNSVEDKTNSSTLINWYSYKK